jgi:hypothetical protein
MECPREAELRYVLMRVLLFNGFALLHPPPPSLTPCIEIPYESVQSRAVSQSTAVPDNSTEKQTPHSAGNLFGYYAARYTLHPRRQYIHAINFLRCPILYSILAHIINNCTSNYISQTLNALSSPKHSSRYKVFVF